MLFFISIVIIQEVAPSLMQSQYSLTMSIREAWCRAFCRNRFIVGKEFYVCLENLEF